MEFSSDQRKRMAAFAISSADLDLLQGQRRFAHERLPGLLVELHSTFAEWPEIHQALMLPAVHRCRLAHWARVVCGELGTGFKESADALAEAFYQHDVPAYAVALCHASVVQGILKAQGLFGERGFLVRGGKRASAAKATLRDVLQRIAWLDLEVLLETYTRAEDARRSRALNEMATTIEREAGAAMSQVSGLTAELAKIAAAISATAAKTDQNAGEAASSTGETLASAQSVASAAEQLSASVGAITRQVNGSSAAAQRAVAAGQGVQESIAALSREADQIGQVAQMIADIASRTNLLALNATIEAARAGEAGRGFSVVANEVKQLANQTAQSTEKITQQIGAVRQATKDAANEVANMAAMIGEIESIAVAVAAAVEEQGSATANISHSINATARAVGETAERMNAVRGAVSETDRQAETVRHTAVQLDGAVGELQQAVNHIVRTSSSMVNRRAEKRIETRLRGRLSMPGVAMPEVEVMDLSRHGASVICEAKPASGTRGRLSIDGLDLEVTVAGGRAPGRIGLLFVLDASGGARLDRLMERLERTALAA